ncbi:MAG: hypothetical protein OEM97_00570 [Acidimicrobiia bacterium]|nr:hypothetical protein [Acidimicrobiia bacterium]
MRIALYGHQAFGVRVARVLLAERHLDRLGIVGEEVRHPRVERFESVADYDAIIIDRLDLHGTELFNEAFHNRTDVVLVEEAPPVERAMSAVVSDAASPRGLAHALALSTRGSIDEAVEVTIAWTTSGKVRRRGDAVTFPDPVGPRWAEPVEVIESGVHRALAAPGPGSWAAALSRVTIMTLSGLRTTTTAVADDAEFLSASLVAGAAIAACEGAYGSGPCSPADPGGSFLRAVRRAGVESASFSRI